MKENLVDSLYVVGIGASAGGLEAIKTLFSNVKPMRNVSYVLVQHMSQKYKSYTLEILAKITSIPIEIIEDQTIIQGNRIYIKPPGTFLTMEDNHLIIKEETDDFEKSPIDLFLSSLAENKQEHAIGIILSGAGNDGVEGIARIKKNNGIVIVQDKDDAQFDSMPKNAIRTGFTDYICPANEIFEKIDLYLSNPILKENDKYGRDNKIDRDVLDAILFELKKTIQIDFTKYKTNTIIRRIGKRMAISQIRSLQDYYKYLSQNPHEKEQLMKDLLIGVTTFFRNKEAFDTLENEVIPRIFDQVKGNRSIRIWVPGCATGEEVYSIAILFDEFREQIQLNYNIKIFGTDLDTEALKIANKGIYTKNNVEDVNQERLQKYFKEVGNVYQISEKIRSMVILSPHNVIVDPPFLNLDLISCRNLLIYLKPEYQSKVISLFQFGLKDRGYLFMGTSESLGDKISEFKTINSSSKLFQYKGKSNVEILQSFNFPNSGKYRGNTSEFEFDNRISNVIKNVGDNFLEKLLPPSVMINSDFEILRIYNDVNEYLEIPSGRVSTNLLTLSRNDLTVALSTSVKKAIRINSSVVYKNIKIRDRSEQTNVINLRIIPVEFKDELLMLVLFEQENEEKIINPSSDPSNLVEMDYEQRILDLEDQIRVQQANLQETIEELETSNEELQSTNEELLVSNEELQSTNEELQSVNEELNSVNSEYHLKIEELTMVNNDLDVLIQNINIGYIFLDSHLKIRKFSQNVTSVVNLLDIDVNRRINDITTNFEDDRLKTEIEKVHKTGEALEMEMTSKRGTSHKVKIKEYNVEKSVYKGLVITITNLGDTQS